MDKRFDKPPPMLGRFLDVVADHIACNGPIPEGKTVLVSHRTGSAYYTVGACAEMDARIQDRMRHIAAKITRELQEEVDLRSRGLTKNK